MQNFFKKKPTQNKKHRKITKECFYAIEINFDIGFKILLTS